MSGYEPNTQVSKLGGGLPGAFEVGYGNTMVGGEVAMNRKKLRKAFKTNKVSNGNKTISSMSGPFRTAYNLGDPLSRRNWSCGGCSQVNGADSVSNQDCDRVVTISGEEFTTTHVPLASGNAKFVADSSLYTQFKHLKAVNLTYNDKSNGGDQHNGSYSFLNNLRG